MKNIIGRVLIWAIRNMIIEKFYTSSGFVTYLEVGIEQHRIAENCPDV